MRMCAKEINCPFYVNSAWVASACSHAIGIIKQNDKTIMEQM